jgi:hypothetical protein
MLRLFGIVVRLAFGLQIAVIVLVMMGIALLREAAFVRESRPLGTGRARPRKTFPAWNAGAESTRAVPVIASVERTPRN